LQPVTAWYEHYGRPVFDSVLVGNEESEEPWYGQVQLLFSWERQDWALVRWYELAPSDHDDRLAAAGCTRLTWATVGRKKEPWCQVVPFNSILRKLYVVPDFSSRPVAREGQRAEYVYFHVSVFKWERSVPDKRGYAAPMDVAAPMQP
jgi:hypothetical protein